MEKAKKRRRIIWLVVLALLLLNAGVIAGYFHSLTAETNEVLDRERAEMQALWGQNEPVTGDYDHSLARTCDNGTFVGNEKNGVLSFKGIPFAEAPVGDLRWQPPVDAGEDGGVYEALYFGKASIQTEAETERASLYPQGEDCLTLNVWTAAPEEGAEEAPKTVMVFFHGGAYGWGGTSDPIYDGQNFVEAHPDIVLVTANYRVGIMGFVDFSEVPGGEDFEESGNLGLLDQISALRWVKRNIASFGGDTKKVTIFGESAGGSSVSLLPLVDEAKGLFRRVIAESGSIAFTFSRKEAKAFTKMLLEETGTSDMAGLMALTEEELMAANEPLNDCNNFPVRDGVVLPLDVYDAYARGKGAEVDILSGTNADETRYWIGEVGGYPVYQLAGPLLYNAIVEDMQPEDRERADRFMAIQEDEEIWNQTEFLNELIFRMPAVRQAELHTAEGGRDFMYYWTKESAIEHYGACHAVELAYVFGNLDDTIFTGEPADPALAAEVQQMWVNFAKTGDPSTETHRWRRFDPENRGTMILGEETGMAYDPLSGQRILIEPMVKYRFNGYYMMADYALIYLKRRIALALFVLFCIDVVILGSVLIHRSRKQGNQPNSEGA